jgi:hypothetical protein
MKIVLYDPQTDDVRAEFVRSFVPWKLLKKAVGLAKKIDAENMTVEAIDELSGLVVAVFGDRFSVQDLDEGADVGQMMAVLTQIVSTAGGVMPKNLAPPG